MSYMISICVHLYQLPYPEEQYYAPTEFVQQPVAQIFYQIPFLILSFIVISAHESLHSDQADRGAGNQIKQTAFHP